MIMGARPACISFIPATCLAKSAPANTLFALTATSSQSSGTDSTYCSTPWMEIIASIAARKFLGCGRSIHHGRVWAQEFPVLSDCPHTIDRAAFRGNPLVSNRWCDNAFLDLFHLFRYSPLPRNR